LEKKKEAEVAPLESALRKIGRIDGEAKREHSPGEGARSLRTDRPEAQIGRTAAVPKLDFGGFNVQAYVSQQKAQTRDARSKYAVRFKAVQTQPIRPRSGGSVKRTSPRDQEEED
jgi:hypothetical protein